MKGIFFDPNIDFMSWKQNYYSAIVVVRFRGTLSFKKYRNIKKTKREKFEDFLRKEFKGYRYVNYYERDTKLFPESIYL